MLEKIRYENHLRETLQFGEKGIYVNENELHDYDWEIISVNNKISGFKRGVVEKPLPVLIMCSSEEEGIAMRNQLHEICEKDVLALQYGKLHIGDFYLKCYVKASKKSVYLESKRCMVAELKIITDMPSWICEKTTSFRSADEEEEWLDYEYDYPYEYASELKSTVLVNSNFVASQFRIVIYGGCMNPTIYINGHEYCVEATIEESEYLTIDSVEKTITLTRNNGEQVNLFNHRKRDSYIFEKIPAGESPVTWDGEFVFDITLLEERSEPRWT